jgi:hypothetical protein
MDLQQQTTYNETTDKTRRTQDKRNLKAGIV